MDARRALMSSHLGIRFSQLIQQLDELNLRNGEPTSELKDAVGKYANSGQKPPPISKMFLPTLNSKGNLSSRLATCCSPLGPTLLHGQLHRHQPDPKYYKAVKCSSHHPKRKHLRLPQCDQGNSSDIIQGEMPLRIAPAMVTHNHVLRDRRRGGQQGTSNVVSRSCSLVPNRFEFPGAGTSNSSSTGQSSSSSLFIDFPSDDSDLSDQERTSDIAQEWAAPVELDLRPEPFNKNDCDYLESKEDQQSYPEVLPAPLKILDLTQNLFNRVDLERRQNLIRQDLSLFAFANRLVEMERMQMATIQRERTKVGKSRSSTAIGITRSTARIRKADFLGSQSECLVPGMELGSGYPSVLYGLADLTLSHTSLARRRLKTACIPCKQSHNRRDSVVDPTLPKQPHSSATRRSKTRFQSDQSSQDSLLNTVPSYKVDRLKCSKKVTSRLKRKSSRKKTTRSDRKL